MGIELGRARGGDGALDNGATAHDGICAEVPRPTVPYGDKDAPSPPSAGDFFWSSAAGWPFFHTSEHRTRRGHFGSSPQNSGFGYVCPLEGGGMPFAQTKRMPN